MQIRKGMQRILLVVSALWVFCCIGSLLMLIGAIAINYEGMRDHEVLNTVLTIGLFLSAPVGVALLYFAFAVLEWIVAVLDWIVSGFQEPAKPIGLIAPGPLMSAKPVGVGRALPDIAVATRAPARWTTGHLAHGRGACQYEQRARFKKDGKLAAIDYLRRPKKDEPQKRLWPSQNSLGRKALQELR